MGRKPLPPKKEQNKVTAFTYDDLGRIFVQEYKQNWWLRFSMVKERWLPLERMESSYARNKTKD